MIAPARARSNQVRAGTAAERAIAPTVLFYATYRRMGKVGPTWWERVGTAAPTALLVRQHPPSVGRQGERRLTAKGVTDYFGLALRASGDVWPVAFDVKSVRSAVSFQLKPKDRHQVAFIRRVEAWGGVGFLLLLDPLAGRAWLAHGRVLALLATGARVKFCDRAAGVPVRDHLPAVPLAPFGSTGFRGYDFLAALDRADG